MNTAPSVFRHGPDAEPIPALVGVGPRRGPGAEDGTHGACRGQRQIAPALADNVSLDAPSGTRVGAPPDPG